MPKEKFDKLNVAEHEYYGKGSIMIWTSISVNGETDLSYDVASGSEITPCNKICRPLVVYRFSGNVMTSITTLRTQ